MADHAREEHQQVLPDAYYRWRAGHVTNQMALVEGDFEKGEADGSVDALAVIVAAARAWMSQFVEP